MAARNPALFERAQQAEQRGNREVRDLWDRYRAHREQLTAQILALPSGRLCLLGAGNGNDLDLEPLAAHFDELHLVDLDPSALSRLTGRQTAPVRAKLRSHAPVDLSGLYRQLDRPRLPPADALVTTGATEVLAALPGGFDAVVSCCVLSQMSWAIETLLPPGAPVAELQQALLRIHLRTLLGLLAPAGAALLAADMISSLHHDLEGVPADELPALARQLAAERVAFPVCNPELIRQVLRRDPPLAGSRLSQGAPWLWDGPKELTYLVCPLVLRRGP
jgi:hypothetical protein